MSYPAPHIIIALDNVTQAQADALLVQLDPSQCRVKIGNELFTRAGPRWVEKVIAQGFAVFLDLKYHDIPNTVHNACRAAADLGVWMVNVHTLGGLRMLEAAREAIPTGEHSPLLIGVTILTSSDTQDLQQVGLMQTPEDHVLQLAQLAKQAQLDGLVCSAKEAPLLRMTVGGDLCLVTPGIRPQGSESQDQKRTMTPRAALDAGANYLVIGRPITQANDPAQVLQDILAEIH